MSHTRPKHIYIYILFTNIDVPRHILMVDTSVLAKSNIGRREYFFSVRTYVHTQSTGYVAATVLTSTESIASKCSSTLRFCLLYRSVLDRQCLPRRGFMHESARSRLAELQAYSTGRATSYIGKKSIPNHKLVQVGQNKL
jgi:hypothetical protein